MSEPTDDRDEQDEDEDDEQDAPAPDARTEADKRDARWLGRWSKVWVPIIGAISMRANIKGTADASPEAARLATRLWHEAFNSTVKIAYGTEKFSIALPFYSADNPAEFTHFDFGQAPWITPERLKAEGLLSVCAKADRSCIDLANTLANPRTKTLERQVATSAWGQTGRAVDLVIIMTPPQ